MRRREFIAGPGSAAAWPLAAKSATTRIPIVFETGGDPVELGLGASLNRPGGNLTGVATLGPEVAAKRLELLHELVPAATSITLLQNSGRNSADAQMEEALRAAAALGLRLQILNASSQSELEMAFETLVQHRTSAILVSPDPFFTGQREQIIAMAVRSVIPAMYAWREYALAGGLISYGTSRIDAYRLVGAYAGHVIAQREALLSRQHHDVGAIFRHIDSTIREHSHLRTPFLLMRARAQATVRVWKKRPELQAHSRFESQNDYGLPVATGAVS